MIIKFVYNYTRRYGILLKLLLAFLLLSYPSSDDDDESNNDEGKMGLEHLKLSPNLAPGRHGFRNHPV